MAFSNFGKNPGAGGGSPAPGFGSGSSSFPSSEPARENNASMIFGKPAVFSTPASGPSGGNNNVSMIFGKLVQNPQSNFVGPTPVFGSTNSGTSKSPFPRPKNNQLAQQNEPTQVNNVPMIFGKPAAFPTSTSNIHGPTPVFGGSKTNGSSSTVPFSQQNNTSQPPPQNRNVGPRPAFGITKPNNSTVPFSQPHNGQPPPQSRNVGPRPAFGTIKPSSSSIPSSPLTARLRPPQNTNGGPRPAFNARNPNTPIMPNTTPRNSQPSPQNELAMNNNSSFPAQRVGLGRGASSNVRNNVYSKNVGPRPTFGGTNTNPSSTSLSISPPHQRQPPNRREPDPQSPTEAIYQNAPTRNRSPVSYQDLDNPTAFQESTNNRRLVNYADSLLDDTVNNTEPSKRMRSPHHEIQRSDAQLETEELNQNASKRNTSPLSNRLKFPNTNGENSARNENAVFENAGTSGPPKQIRSPTNVFQRLNTPPKAETLYQNAPKRNLSPELNQDFGSRPALAGPNGKRQVASRDFSVENSVDSSKRMRSPIREIPRFEDPPAQTEACFQNAPNRNRSPASNRDTNFGLTSQDPAGRRPVAYTDYLLDSTSDEPTIVKQSIPHQVQRQNASPTRQREVNRSPQKDDDAIKSKRLVSLNASNDSASPSTQLFADREEEAKAKRLARFGAELSQPVEERVEVSKQINEPNEQHEIEFSEATAIVGLCPDMCSEPERDERERKGDLDRHERLDGDRNKTSKFLAVKKYTRTAERDANLIRPLPILMKTMDYLLELLNRPYGPDFLSLYNFLWDRMRAIRLDLRMQHIFNQQAISMLEQMIRLHIIAMHELCEYNKGEGFSEGFDAHLNIEQMNKASVDLFQMYDDHRRKGIVIPSEKEFRGYYALLKLDKHPGYKVESCELSLDLAKMSLEVRRSPEISFARNVSRACRMGNYMSFFRLAKKASYLQGCLMHAHFFKLRTQALASLHNCFQSNQGMPISELEGWLAMNGEDIESFVQSHSFVMKQFEEKYIVKEGPFVRQEENPKNRRSPLVDMKKSETIKNDVFAPPARPIISNEVTKLTGIKRVVPEPAINVPVDSPRPVKISNLTQVDTQPVESQQVAKPEVKKPGFQIPASASVFRVDVNDTEFPSTVMELKTTKPAQLVAQPAVQPVVRPVNPVITSREPLLEASSDFEAVVVKEQEKKKKKKKEVRKEKMIVVLQEEKKKEFPKEKLKVMLRKWKHKTAEKRKAREIKLRKEKKAALTQAALDYLSVGPLLRTGLRTNTDTEPVQVRKALNIDRAIRERYKRREKSWSLLNLSNLVTPILSERNPDARCLCWKLFLSLPPGRTDSLSSKWLLKKFDLKRETDDNSFVSVSEKWSGPQLSLSFVRADNTGSFKDDFIAGASCVMFLVQENIPLEMQQIRLNNIVNRVQARSKLPLLVLIGDNSVREEEGEIISKLGLSNVDRTKIRGVSVIFLKEDSEENVFFDDARLRKGVSWLAEESPLQTEVISVNMRDIFFAYLNPKYQALCDSSETGPDQCISAFNETLDRLNSEILLSASSNPNFWPGSEIDLLGKDTSERNYAEMTLPKPAWSRPEKIELQINAINSCKLLGFVFDLSWLNQGSYFTDKKQILEKKKAIEECLFTYLTQSTQTVDLTEAREEIRVLVQRYSSLVLRDSCLYIVPKWTAIFRQLFYLRLRKIEKDEVYVRDQNAILEYFKYTPKGPQVRTLEVPLNEMIERCCSVPSMSASDDLADQEHEETQTDDVAHLVQETDKEMEQEHGETRTDDVAHPVRETDKEECGVCEREEWKVSDDVADRVREVADIMGPLFKRERSDRLLLLLEECNKLQDSIDEKLSFYF
ncbi:hypothetical protein LUZ60_014091 [Juncus effusus]|nr:hypothetical protein LUZ60_014091 [Juncus effusus]